MPDPLTNNLLSDDSLLPQDFTFKQFEQACQSQLLKERWVFACFFSFCSQFRVNAAKHLAEAASRSEDFDFEPLRFVKCAQALLGEPGEVRTAALDKLRDVFAELSTKSEDMCAGMARVSAPLLVRALHDGSETEQSSAVENISFLIADQIFEQGECNSFGAVELDCCRFRRGAEPAGARPVPPVLPTDPPTRPLQRHPVRQHDQHRRGWFAFLFLRESRIVVRLMWAGLEHKCHAELGLDLRNRTEISKNVSIRANAQDVERESERMI